MINWYTELCNKYIHSQLLVTCIDHTYVTEYWKTDQNVTLGLFCFIDPADSHTHTLPVHYSINRPNWLVCFSRAGIANHVKSWLGQWGLWWVLYGRCESDIPPVIEISLRPSRLVRAYDQHFLDSYNFQMVLMKALTCLQLSKRPHHPPLSPTHPLICAIHELQWLWKMVLKI